MDGADFHRFARLRHNGATLSIDGPFARLVLIMSYKRDVGDGVRPSGLERLPEVRVGAALQAGGSAS